MANVSLRVFKTREWKMNDQSQNHWRRSNKAEKISAVQVPRAAKDAQVQPRIRSRYESKLENASRWPEAQAEDCSGEQRKDKDGGRNKRETQEFDERKPKVRKVEL